MSQKFRNIFWNSIRFVTLLVYLLKQLDNERIFTSYRKQLILESNRNKIISLVKVNCMVYQVYQACHEFTIPETYNFHCLVWSRDRERERSKEVRRRGAEQSSREMWRSFGKWVRSPVFLCRWFVVNFGLLEADSR